MISDKVIFFKDLTCDTLFGAGVASLAGAAVGSLSGFTVSAVACNTITLLSFGAYLASGKHLEEQFIEECFSSISDVTLLGAEYGAIIAALVGGVLGMTGTIAMRVLSIKK